MLITPQFVEVKSMGKNKSYFESKGYEFVNKKTLVSVEDLPKGSHVKVKVLCDYCLEKGINTIIIKTYKNYINQNEKQIIHKDACVQCRYEKTMESNQKTYGKKHVLELESTSEKRIQTNLDKYGSGSPMGNLEVLEKAKATSREKFGKDFYMQTEEYKGRVVETNLSKYGTLFTFQSEEIKKKIKETNLERYGFEYVSQSPIIQEKVRRTHLDRFGVEVISKIPEVQKEALRKAKITMYKEGNAPTSIPQRYLHYLLDGELNYPEGVYSLDIAFPEEKIYIEYDGGGHKLSVVFNNLSIDDFKKREMKRYYYLRGKGWRVIRIVSEKDYIPSLEILKKMLSLSNKVLTSRTWIKFDIDKGKVETSKGKLNYNFGELVSRNVIIKEYQNII